jgi:hypothetical protein
MKRKFFTNEMFLALGILAGFTALGLVIKTIRPGSSGDSFFLQGIILSSLPFWLTSKKRKGNCKTLDQTK